VTELAGEPVLQILDRAPGNGAPLGGIKVAGARAWFAARPSGTEDLYKIYAESFVDPAHLQAVLQQAQTLVDGVLADVQ
jgi:phosphoglucomutase